MFESGNRHKVQARGVTVQIFRVRNQMSTGSSISDTCHCLTMNASGSSSQAHFEDLFREGRVYGGVFSCEKQFRCRYKTSWL